MSDKKYQVFVSSTFKDLAKQRRMVIQGILDLQHIPAGMEMFPATDTDQLEYIKKIIDQCDYYVLIMANMYGSMTDGVSYTEQEYDYAVSQGKFVLAFPHSQPETQPFNHSDTDEDKRTALSAFRQKVMRGRLVREWSSDDKLEAQIIKALVHAFNNYPQIGWVRGDSIANSDVILRNNELLEENNNLKSLLSDLKPVPNFKVDDIASLDEEISISMKIKNWNYASDYEEDHSQLIITTWRSLFISIASHIKGVSDDIVIKNALVSLLPERKREMKTSITELQKATIKSQLEAFGLILVKSDIKNKQTLELTELGNRTMREQLVIRKKEGGEISSI
ncbi:DUF4062 domain-containing protein [Brucella sp. TWI559]